MNAIDLLGFQPAKRRWWVFELKRGRAADERLSLWEYDERLRLRRVSA